MVKSMVCGLSPSTASSRYSRPGRMYDSSIAGCSDAAFGGSSLRFSGGLGRGAPIAIGSEHSPSDPWIDHYDVKTEPLGVFAAAAAAAPERARRGRRRQRRLRALELLLLLLLLLVERLLPTTNTLLYQPHYTWSRASCTAHAGKLYVFGGEPGALGEVPLWVYDTERCRVFAQKLADQLG
ncbi:hypothetical protein MSG28_010547 [Choristoneura fumiferana]|uniref:Uncharacterized protein n=1 Tax=Choristoneura fumiferana TaxID=7141 RepID=A0ACC0KL36_CHOFU|nr:hypothetical protein MSG28_010547 [Choristoneura fumiferana]